MTTQCTRSSGTPLSLACVAISASMPPWPLRTTVAAGAASGADGNDPNREVRTEGCGAGGEIWAGAAASTVAGTAVSESHAKLGRTGGSISLKRPDDGATSAITAWEASAWAFSTGLIGGMTATE